jgi:hypothetical protein
VSGLDWPALRALIDAGHPPAVVAAVEGLADRQRRALATPLKSYPQVLRSDPRGWWGGRGGRTVALRIAGAGCLSGPDTVARWLTRQDLRGWDSHRGTAHLLQVLQARDLPWLPELTRRLAGRLRTDRWEDDIWRLTASLVTISGIEPPTTDGFVVGWTRTPRPDDRHRGGFTAALAADPFLTAVAPRLFEVDGVGGLLAWSASPSAASNASWPRALASLAANGRLDRAMLLDGCLGRLLGGGGPAELRGFLLLHQALDPDLEEVGARARDYARLLADGPSPVAQVAQRALRRVDDAGRLEPGLLVEATRAVLARPETTLVRGQLSWLDAAARRHPDRAGDLLAAVSVAFAQDRSGLQARALALVARHLRHADQAARAELLAAAAVLPADLRQRAGAALGGRVPTEPAPWPVLLPPTPRQLPPPIGTPAELAEELAAFLERRPAVDPLALERLLAALVAFAHRDRATLGDALAPVLTRHRIPSLLPPVNPPPNHYLVNEYQQLCWAILAAVTPPGRGWLLRRAMDAIWVTGHRRWRHSRLLGPGPRRAMLERLHEIALGLALATPPPLLVATPTSVTGQLDPAELVARLELAAAGGWQPGRYDLEQALLRLPREADPAAAARARRLPTPAGRRLARWLATGGLSDPEVTRVLRTVRGPSRWLPPGAPPVADSRVRVLATVASRQGPAGPPAPPSPLAVARQVLPQPPSLAAWLCDLTQPEWWDHWALGEWLGCWPALLPSHRDVIAAHLQPRLAQLPAAASGDGPVLVSLAEADGPVGPGLTLALAYGLGARDPTDRAAAVDALLLLAGRRQLDGPALGVELAALVALDLLPLRRLAPGLRDIARSGAPAEVWAILAAAIPGMLPPAVERPPRGLPDLLAVGAEVVGAGGGQAIPALTAISGRGGSSRLVAESRRLQRLLAPPAVPLTS